ncbi:MAG: FlaA1/EpsC-like NDP-sugar epimerase [Ulvibacter sp.]|jgi:FlaA1/EpsC-like NDP-sugar epimerase
MIPTFDLDKFITEKVVGRSDSLFSHDISQCHLTLKEKIKGKSILVIGGAGTIGSSFIKAILPFHPGKLTVVDYSENGLTELTRDLRSSYNEFIPEEYITYPFDFGGKIFEKLYLANQYDIVACFAAHKHVRSEKDHLAIEAMIRNNVYNTKKLLDLALINKPEHFFCVSTDKAANPVNVMGASKKIMEKVLMAYSDDIKISTARFANVAFSNGSLLFGFNERMAKRQPLSSPSDIKRYFVSPIESGQLCMLACLLGESKDIFFPKLEETQMMTFSAIAEQYLHELGLEPDYCDSEQEARDKALVWTANNKKYPVYFFKSDTSGEKSYEEFFTLTDSVSMNLFEALGVIKNEDAPNRKEIKLLIEEFDYLFANKSINKSDIVKLLKRYLPDFSHIETGKSLDQKM